MNWKKVLPYSVLAFIALQIIGYFAMPPWFKLTGYPAPIYSYSCPSGGGACAYSPDLVIPAIVIDIVAPLIIGFVILYVKNKVKK